MRETGYGYPHVYHSPFPASMEFFSDIGGSALEPSLFELVAQEQLRDLLQPALKYVLAVRVTESWKEPMYN